MLANFLLPDRDNTAFAYTYREDGEIEVSTALPAPKAALAKSTLELVGLDKPISEVADENGQLVAVDRVGQRMEAWLIAQDVGILANSTTTGEKFALLLFVCQTNDSSVHGGQE